MHCCCVLYCMLLYLSCSVFMFCDFVCCLLLCVVAIVCVDAVFVNYVLPKDVRFADCLMIVVGCLAIVVFRLLYDIDWLFDDYVC